MNKYQNYLTNEELSMSTIKQKKKEKIAEDDGFIKKGKWSKEEDDRLSELVPLFGGKNWKKISQHIKGRSSIQCLHRWTKILQPGLVKGPWTLEEDRKLIEWVRREGPSKWSLCAEYIKGRTSKQCRERWFNTLNPSVKKGNWDVEEDYKIFILFRQFGGKWSKISQYFKGRTENSVKNRFYSTLRKIYTEKKKESFVKRNTMSTHLDELMVYFNLAFSNCKAKLVKSKNFSNEDLEQYEKELLESHPQIEETPREVAGLRSQDILKQIEKPMPIKNDNGASTTTLTNNNNPTFNLNVNFNNSFICSSQPQVERKDSNLYYKSMDISSLENQILDMCDNSSFLFSDNTNNYFNFDNHIDNIVDNLFDRNYITVDDSKPCGLCTDDKLLNSEPQPELNTVTPPSVTSDNKKEMLDSLFKQLSDIEKAVHMTKKELMKIEMNGGQDCEMISSNLFDSLFKF
jgi:hypothetical protein